VRSSAARLSADAQDCGHANPCAWAEAYAPADARRAGLTAGAERAPKYVRIFGQRLFWVPTRAIRSRDCVGHSDRNWEVAGLPKPVIAERGRLLAGDPPTTVQGGKGNPRR
jgi:hypothetical protein